MDIDPTLEDGGQSYFEQRQAKHGYMLSVAVRRGPEVFRGVVRHSDVFTTPLPEWREGQEPRSCQTR